MREVLASKIFRATVTSADLDYEGSISIDEALLEKAGLWNGQKVLIVDFTNGERLETYIQTAKIGSGIIQINGGAARKIKKGHIVTIFGFEITDKKIKAKKIAVNEKNKFVKFL